MKSFNALRSATLIILLALLALLVGFFLKSQAIDPAQHYRFLGNLRQLQALESVIKVDLLKTRFGLDPNYDRLVWHGDQIRLSVSQLQQSLAVVIPHDRTHLDNQFREVATILANQASLTERFKAQNAVFQNSLRYFPTITQTILDELADRSADRPLRAPIEDLLKSLLIYSLNGHEELKPHIQATIDALDALKSTQPDLIQTRLDNMLLHGRAILRLKAALADGMAEIINMPVTESLDRFTTAYDNAQTKIFQQASLYRGGLYGICLGLLGFVILLVRSQDRARVLRAANVNLEQVVADRTQELRASLHNFQQSQVQLVQSEKMAGLGQLMAGIAHEINNPVSFIYSNIPPAINYVSELIGVIERYQVAYPKPPSVISKYLEAIDWEFAQTDLPRALLSMKTGADRIREIVLSLRNFSRLDEADKKQANLNDGIESTLLLLQHRLKAQPDREAIQVELNLGDIPVMLCHPGQINQVFMNLLVNAIDALEEDQNQATGRSPCIQIRTERVSPDQPHAVRVEIRDNGAGMTAATQQKLFDPFFTTKPVGKGTGLGMSISYQIIVDRHGGSIHCESVLGQGTTFTIEF